METQPKETRTPEGARPAPTPAEGTTHDPNSVTTGTPEEPTRDVYPPKGERD
ncbi:hypothetical protein [Jannaschia marina]|uniref:hypothetical protein n=1 Tax=Jannaschia marina TaxID=2741674 RepID=UPI0015CC8266|nr:hypothetical protein [Jannaschia marina]